MNSSFTAEIKIVANYAPRKCVLSMGVLVPVEISSPNKNRSWRGEGVLYCYILRTIEYYCCAVCCIQGYPYSSYEIQEFDFGIIERTNSIECVWYIMLASYAYYIRSTKYFEVRSTKLYVTTGTKQHTYSLNTIKGYQYSRVSQLQSLERRATRVLVLLCEVIGQSRRAPAAVVLEIVVAVQVHQNKIGYNILYIGIYNSRYECYHNVVWYTHMTRAMYSSTAICYMTWLTDQISQRRRGCRGRRVKINWSIHVDQSVLEIKRAELKTWPRHIRVAASCC